MHKTFYNDELGAELAAIQRERAPVLHYHTCPKCHEVWSHEAYFCRDMETGGYFNGVVVESVPWICDDCLKGTKNGKGTNGSTGMRPVQRAGHGRSRRSQFRGKVLDSGRKAKA